MAGKEILTDEILETLLYLSRLGLSSEERIRMKQQAEDIISHFDTLSKFGTEKIIGEAGNEIDADMLRKDEIEESLPVNDVKRLSENFLDGYFSVPGIIGKE